MPCNCDKKDEMPAGCGVGCMVLIGAFLVGMVCVWLMEATGGSPREHPKTFFQGGLHAVLGVVSWVILGTVIYGLFKWYEADNKK